jgi:integron integrase
MQRDTTLAALARQPPSSPQPRIIRASREALRLRRYSPKTEKAYVHWVKRFIRFHRMRHPRDMGAVEVTAFLHHLATDRQVAVATQNQALAARLLLDREAIGTVLAWPDRGVRAKTAKRLPTVMTRDEAQSVLAQLSGTRWLRVSLLHGAGLRLNECLSLRVKAIDFSGCKLVARQGKGNKDRVTLMPQRLEPVLIEHLERVKALHARDLARGLGEAPLPRALAGKCPKAGYSWAWEFVFPSANCCRDPYTGRAVRYPIHEKTLQRAVKDASRRAGIAKPVGCHTFRHAFATNLLESGHNSGSCRRSWVTSTSRAR